MGTNSGIMGGYSSKCLIRRVRCCIGLIILKCTMVCGETGGVFNRRTRH